MHLPARPGLLVVSSSLAGLLAVGGAVLVVLGVGVALILLLLRGPPGGGWFSRGAPVEVSDPLREVRGWLADPRYRVFIGDEARGEALRGRGWVELTGDNPPVATPARYAVAYRNGEIVVLKPTGVRIPDDLRWIAPSTLPVPPLPDDASLAAGARLVGVRFDRSPHGGDHHRVVLTNRSATPLRVVWFGAWEERDGVSRFRTITDRPFTGEQFRAWYAVPDPEGWIPPGAEVDDPANYGGGLWVWALESPTGEVVVVGGRRPG